MTLDERQATNPAARQILNICNAGHYEAPSGRVVFIKSEQADSEAGTRLYSPEDLALLRDASPSTTPFSTLVEIIDATTQQAAQALSHYDGVALLNFASARNPGGGFLGGAKAQEEELCRCSGLYPTLLTQPSYYEYNRNQKTLLYSDFTIYSPRVPFIRLETKEAFLERPFYASVITAPAPNAGALARNEPHSASDLPSTFERRWANVLSVAQHNRDRVLVLGAWGCGAFRNEPAMVAATAKSTLSSPRFNGVFERIVFAIPGIGERSRLNLQAFRNVFCA
ncbi:MAG: TIGR02452 family protein [Myxococcota bacterium]